MIEQLEIEAHYASYLARQVADIGAFRAEEFLLLPRISISMRSPD